MSAGLLSGRSRVQSPAGPPTRVFKITGKIMLAVIKDLVSVQMIASLGGDVKPLALVSLIIPYQLEGDVKEPTLLCEKSRDADPGGMVYLS